MKYFTFEEVRCRCGRPECDAPVSLIPELGDRLDTLRERLGRPLVITSGLRCAWQNERTPGAVPFSGHCDGTEVDFACKMSRERYAVLAALFQGARPLFPRIGLYARHVHVGLSVRLPGQVVWVNDVS